MRSAPAQNALPAPVIVDTWYDDTLRAALLQAWMPWLILTVFVFIWGLPPVKKFLNGIYAPQFPIEGLHNLIQKVPPVVPTPHFESAVYTLNLLSATGTDIKGAPSLSADILGDWREGEKLAQNGRGMTWTDKSAAPAANGGNCYNCHQISKAEISFGTIGPSLYNYGKTRGVTDPDSAKMATGKGVIQGYAAQAAVDSQHQIIVAADVTGSGSEQAMLLPMVRASDGVRSEDTLITADAGYHSSENLQALEAGIANLERHVRNVREHYGLPCVVSINNFTFDTEAELALLQERMTKHEVAVLVARHSAAQYGARRAPSPVRATARVRPSRPGRGAMSGGCGAWWPVSLALKTTWFAKGRARRTKGAAYCRGRRPWQG